MVPQDDKLIPNGPEDPEIPVVTINFVAEPASIRPFETSVLKWKVEMEGAGALTVQLNGIQVNREDQRVVQPADTTSYTLTAEFPINAKLSRTVTVTVDTGACVSRAFTDDSIASVANQLRDELSEFVEGVLLLDEDKEIDAEIGAANTLLIFVPLKVPIPTAPGFLPARLDMTFRISVKDVKDEQGVLIKREAKAILINLEFLFSDALSSLKELIGRFLKKCAGPQLEEQIGRDFTKTIDEMVLIVEAANPQLGKIMLQAILTDEEGQQLVYRMCPVIHP
jgi:hypothetical protein